MTQTLTDADIDALLSKTEVDRHPFFWLARIVIDREVQFVNDLSTEKKSEVMKIVDDFVQLNPSSFQVPRDFRVDLYPYLSNVDALVLKMSRWLWDDGIVWDVPRNEPISKLLRDFLNAGAKAGL
jgi:hypothetical protein